MQTTGVLLRCINMGLDQKSQADAYAITALLSDAATVYYGNHVLHTLAEDGKVQLEDLALDQATDSYKKLKESLNISRYYYTFLFLPLLIDACSIALVYSFKNDNKSTCEQELAGVEKMGLAIRVLTSTSCGLFALAYNRSERKLRHSTKLISDMFKPAPSVFEGQDDPSSSETALLVAGDSGSQQSKEDSVSHNSGESSQKSLPSGGLLGSQSSNHSKSSRRK